MPALVCVPVAKLRPCTSTLQPCLPHRSLRGRAAPRAVTQCSNATAKHPSQLQLGTDIPVKLQTVTAGGREFILCVPDIDAVMELYISAGQNDRDPYWCEPWPSALAMAAELLARPELVAGKRVCELGCGLGLAGLAAAFAGASEVVLLDREPLALQCALLNASLNGLPTAFPGQAAADGSSSGSSSSGGSSGQSSSSGAGGSSGGGSSGSPVQPPSLEQLLPHLPSADAELLLELHQRRKSHSEASSSTGGSSGSSGGSGVGGGGGSNGGSAGAPTWGLVRAEVFDWSEPVTLAPHDVMLVCDCLYESFSVQPVAAVAPKLLNRRDARLLLADPPDRARHNRECFLDILCDESGTFLVEESTQVAVPTWEASKGSWRSVPVEIMHLFRGGPGSNTVGVKLRRGKE